MANPMFSNNTSPNGSTNPVNPLTDTGKHRAQGHNIFSLDRVFLNTERYADINLVEVLEGVEQDKLKFGVKHQVRAHTLKDPKMFNINKRISYFLVDKKAILPNNWEKVYKQPNKGDDVNAASVNTVSQNMFYFFFDYLNTLYDFTPSASSNTWETARHYVRQVLVTEAIFSNGSLLASMNAHLAPMLAANLNPDNHEESWSFDTWLEDFYQTIVKNLVIRSTVFNTIFTIRQTDDVSYTQVTPSFLADYIRTYSDWSIVDYESQISGTPHASPVDLISDIVYYFQMLFDPHRRGSGVDYTDKAYHFNYGRLIAYQLVCAQFYSRDSVDDLYTAELWQDNQKSLVLNTLISNIKYPTFAYNGMRFDYDPCAGAVFDQMFSAFFSTFDSHTQIIEKQNTSLYYYLRNIFFYRKSLRFGDYFNGAKTLPYSPLDMTADVVGDGVSAVDMTRSIIAQRFANAVERFSNTFKDYIKDITGGVTPPNPLEPRFLSSVTSSVNGFEVENTASDQGNIVTILNSSDSKYIYSVDVGTPCIIIGVSTYFVNPIYSESVDRFFSHVDRFDMFNKYFQNIGDQSISQFERSSRLLPTEIFGYTPRHMEYKQRISYAAGAFVNSLRGFAFLADSFNNGNNEGYSSKLVVRQIGPEYIRNLNFEMDRFFTSLTGMSLANYYHFILRYNLHVVASRAMDYSPSIL